jgi:type II secretory pathway predicted ATPase ExeA
MLQEVQTHFGLIRPLYGAGIFETEHHRQILREVPAAVMTGRLAVISGLVGCGKTVLLRRLEDELARQKIVVAKSLAVDKERTTLATLIDALFYDLSPEKDVKIPKHGEKRERELRELVRKQRRPIALIVDEAHDLHPKTLTGLKRLMEVVAGGGGTLSVILSGHPKLRNDLRRPSMEEIGYRMTVFDFDGIVGHQREYIDWLLKICAAEDVALTEMIDEATIELLAARLRTPLQIERHLTLAFEEAYRLGAKPVPVEIADGVLSRQIDDLEPTLTRHGYDVRTLAEQFSAKPVEIKAFLAGTLHADRARELTEAMKAAGVPV